MKNLTFILGVSSVLSGCALPAGIGKYYGPVKSNGVEVYPSAQLHKVVRVTEGSGVQWEFALHREDKTSTLYGSIILPKGNRVCFIDTSVDIAADGSPHILKARLERQIWDPHKTKPESQYISERIIPDCIESKENIQAVFPSILPKIFTLLLPPIEINSIKTERKRILFITRTGLDIVPGSSH